MYTSLNFWTITSIRNFFVLSSFIQIIYIIIPLIFTGDYYLSYINIFFYMVFCVHLFVLILYCSNIIQGPLTNLSIWSKDYILLISFITLVLNIGGIPPLSGFFIKFLIIFNLLLANEYLIFVWILVFSFTVVYFYLYIFKFLTLKTHKFNYIKFYKTPTPFIIVNIYICILLNWFSIFYIIDLIHLFKILIKMGNIEFVCVLVCISFFGFVLFWFSLIFSFFFSKTGSNKKYREFYECGFKPNTNSLITPDIQFGILGIFFLLYDIEIILLAPLFLNIMNSNLYLILFIWVSIFILALSYIYEWDSYSFIWIL